MTNSNFFIFILCIFIPYFTVKGVEFQFVGPCTDVPLVKGEMPINTPISVGDITLEFLDSRMIPYTGSYVGFNSIFNTPVGIDSMEVVDNQTMRAHGWCYAVNGISPESYPHKVYVQDTDRIDWWFGYALYKDGEWVTQCSPTYKVAPEQFCKN